MLTAHCGLSLGHDTELQLGMECQGVYDNTGLEDTLSDFLLCQLECGTDTTGRLGGYQRASFPTFHTVLVACPVDSLALAL